MASEPWFKDVECNVPTILGENQIFWGSRKAKDQGEEGLRSTRQESGGFIGRTKLSQL